MISPITSTTTTVNNSPNTPPVRRHRVLRSVQSDDIMVSPPTPVHSHLTNHTIPDFDWELSGSHASGASKSVDDADFDQLQHPNHHRRCHGLSAFYSNLPFGLQCLIAVLFGDALIFAIIGLPDVFFTNQKGGFIFKPDQVTQWTSNLNIGGMPLILWSFYLMITYTLHWVVLYVLNVLPTILQQSLVVALGSFYHDRLLEYTNLVRALHRNLTVAAWAILSNVSWTFLFRSPVFNWQWQPKYCKETLGLDECPANVMWWDHVGTALLAILFSSLIWTCKRLLVVIIVTRFQRSAFSSRIKKTKFADEVLRRLLSSLKRNKPSARLSPPNARSARSSVPWTIPDPVTTDTTVQPTSLKQKGLTRARKMFARKAQQLAMGVGHVLLDPTALHATTSIPATTTDAHMLARNLYYALVSPNADEVGVADFEPYFDSPVDANRAFRLFDNDMNGGISKQEVKTILVSLVDEKHNLELSMEDTAKAVASLEHLFDGIALLLIGMVMLSVFRVSIDFASLLALLVPFSFVFGNTFKELFEALIFLFVYQSFSVGDRIVVDKENYVVKSLSVFTTILQRGNGRIVHYPNSVLCKKPIENMRQSGPMQEEIELRLALDTPATKIYALETSLREFIVANSKDYIAEGFQVYMKDIRLDVKYMSVQIYIPHKANWQDIKAKQDRRNRFLHAVNAAVLVADIHSPAGVNIFAPYEATS